MHAKQNIGVWNMWTQNGEDYQVYIVSKAKGETKINDLII